MKRILYLALFLFMSCQSNVGKDMPLVEIEQKVVQTKVIKKVAKLGESIKDIDYKSISKKLDAEEERRFLNRVEELKSHYNSLIRKINSNELSDNTDISVELNNVETIWRYLLTNYSI